MIKGNVNWNKLNIFRKTSMKFNADYRNRLEAQLRKNKDEFLMECLKFIEQTKDTHYRMSLEQVAYAFYPFKYDYSIAEASINKTRQIIHNPTIQNRKSAEKSFLANELKFIIHQNEIPKWFTPEQISYTYQRKLLEFKCEEEFWEDIKNERLYKTVPEFECFENPIFSSEKINYHKNKLKYLLHKNWTDYYLRLIALHFQDYVYNEKLSNSKTKRFLKPINNKISIGIEFDVERCMKTIKRNEFAPPDYVNIILINEYFEKNISYNDYILKYNENILSLGICGNPLFL